MVSVDDIGELLWFWWRPGLSARKPPRTYSHNTHATRHMSIKPIYRLLVNKWTHNSIKEFTQNAPVQ